MNSKLKQAVEMLKQGGVVVYPTDTAYGLAVDATNIAAVKKLYAVKGRDFRKPVHVIPPTKAWIEKIVRLTRQSKKIINELMPGPITLVLPLKVKSASWNMLAAGTKNLGIRRPEYKLALDLATGLGKPITTTSANISGQPNCYSISEVKKQFAKSKLKPDFYLDGGRLRKVKPSTVVQIFTSPPAPLLKGERSSKRRNSFDVKILRQGPITEKQIKKALT